MEKVADPNSKVGNGTQRNMKGKRKRTKKTTTTEKNTENNSNINAMAGEHVSAINLGGSTEVSQSSNSAPFDPCSMFLW